MNRLLSMLILMGVLLGGASGVRAEEAVKEKAPEKAENADIKITKLIIKLAELTNQGELCGLQLNEKGKNALKGKECTQFTSGLAATWPDLNAMNNEVDSYINSAEQGTMPCDDVCQSKLQRAGELRITIIYYLDYIEFMRDF